MTDKMRRKVLICGGASLVGASGILPIGVQAASGSGIVHRVGVLTSMTGQYGVYGQSFVTGFEGAVNYWVRKASSEKVGKIELVVRDVSGDPNAAISAATELVGSGVTILTGPTDSSVGLRVAQFAGQNHVLYINGMAGTTALVGINKYTFQSARKAYQVAAAQVAAYREDLKPSTKVALVGSNSNFGKSSLDALEALIKPTGAHAVRVTDSLTTKSFVAVIQKLLAEKPTITYSTWVGDTMGALWEAFNAAQLQDQTKLVTELLAKEKWPVYGKAGLKTAFVTPYIGNIIDNEPARVFAGYLKETKRSVNSSAAAGYVAGSMVAAALRANDYKDVDGMVETLSHWSGETIQGSVRVRPEDHLLLMPMYVMQMAEYSTNPDEIKWKIVRTLDDDATALPLKE